MARKASGPQGTFEVPKAFLRAGGRPCGRHGGGPAGDRRDGHSAGLPGPESSDPEPVGDRRPAGRQALEVSLRDPQWPDRCGWERN